MMRQYDEAKAACGDATAPLPDGGFLRALSRRRKDLRKGARTNADESR